MTNANSPQLPRKALLLIPHLRVQNANAISSPLTWGFPAITAFTGLMVALQRKLGAGSNLRLNGIGVVCHHIEPQVTSEGYTRTFHLTRNPVLQDGSTAAIVEEGRVHMEISLVFDATLHSADLDSKGLEELARKISNTLAGMRIAGGSVTPLFDDEPLHPVPGQLRRADLSPALAYVPDDEQGRLRQFRRVARRLMPGFALVCRDDLLQARLSELQAANAQASLVDAWLDFARWTSRATQITAAGPLEGQERTLEVRWVTDRREGWLVPLTVGFAALSDLQHPGSVAGARSAVNPFCFVESIWSVGQWISPHRLKSLTDLTWSQQTTQDGKGCPLTYRCINQYTDNPALLAASHPTR